MMKENIYTQESEISDHIRKKTIDREIENYETYSLRGLKI